MSYLDNHLLPGERLCYRTFEHWYFLVRPALFLLLALLVTVFASVAFIPFMFLGCAWLGFCALRQLTSEFGVTDRRLIIKHGILRQQSMETLLAKIESIHVSQSLLGRILGFGTLLVTGTGASDAPLPRICDPMELRRQIQGQIAERHINWTVRRSHEPSQHAEPSTLLQPEIADFGSSADRS